MSLATAVVLALLAAPARGASEFREALKRAEARDASDPERVEYATRAIRAWLPADGRMLLSHAHLRRAEGLLLRRDEAAAVEDLTKVVENDPGNHKAVLLRAKARLAAGKVFEAEGDFAAYTSAKPDDAEGWIGLAQSRLPDTGVGRPPEARKAAARARRLAPDDWRPDWLEGRAYRLEKAPDAALAPLERALTRAKGVEPAPYAERALVSADLGRHADAKADWTRAIALHERGMVAGERTLVPEKTRAEGRIRLAEAYVSRGRISEFLIEPDAARADYTAACELGHTGACDRLKAAIPKPVKKRRPAPEVKPDAEETPAPKPMKRLRKRPSNDSGDRVYGS